MTLADLYLRATSAARSRGVTLKSLFADCGVAHSTFHKARSGTHAMRRETALRLLPLVAGLVRGGEPVCLIFDDRTITARDAAAHSPS